MALGYKTRKRLAILILLVGLPLYVIVAVNLVSLIDRPGILIEFAVYAGLGIVWILPLKSIFKGIGQSDPNEKADGR